MKLNITDQQCCNATQYQYHNNMTNVKFVINQIWYFKSDRRGYLIKGNMAITRWLLCCPSQITSPLCAFSQPSQKPQLQTGCWLPCCLPRPLQSRLFLINTCLADPHTFPRPHDSVLWHEKRVDGWYLKVFLKMRTLLCIWCKDHDEFLKMYNSTW